MILVRTDHPYLRVGHHTLVLNRVGGEVDNADVVAVDKSALHQ
jgi:hypothetical protein